MNQHIQETDASIQAASTSRFENCIRPGRVAWSVVTRLVLICAVFRGCSAQAVIFYSTSDTNYNTTRPTGALADSGWENQGDWGSFLGAPISPQHFITAKHLGGDVGGKFVLNDVEYTTAAFYDDPESDLRIWRIRGRFPTFAQLYPRSDEVGKNVVVFGRGTQRGSEVTVSSFQGSTLKGWQWGAPDGRKRWGQNQVGAVASRNPGANGDGMPPSQTTADLLRVPFDADGGPNEVHLSAGDSGGGLFISDGGVWKLAGVNYVVDGPYNTSDTGSGFQAAIFDEAGLYKGGDGNWTKASSSFSDVPGAFYSTRISIRVVWINNILSQTSVGDAPILQSAPALTGPFADELGADVDTTAKVVTVPTPPEARFYRLNHTIELRIIGVTLQSGSLVFQYQ